MDSPGNPDELEYDEHKKSSKGAAPNRVVKNRLKKIENKLARRNVRHASSSDTYVRLEAKLILALEKASTKSLACLQVAQKICNK